MICNKKRINEIVKRNLSVFLEGKNEGGGIPDNLKMKVELICDNFKQYGQCLLSDEKTVEIINSRGAGEYFSGYEFAALPYPNQENKLNELINQIKLMGFFVQDYSEEYSYLEDEGFYVFVFGYKKGEKYYK